MQQISSLLEREVTRSEFLTIAGFGIAALIGLGPVLEFLGKKNPIKLPQVGAHTNSYGGITRRA